MQSCFHILPRLLIYHRVWLKGTCTYHMQWQESIMCLLLVISGILSTTNLDEIQCTCDKLQSCINVGYILPMSFLWVRQGSTHLNWTSGKHWSAENLVRKQKCRNKKRCHTDSQLCMLKPCSLVFWWCESCILVFWSPASVVNTDNATLVLCARYPRLRLCMMPQWTNILVLVNKSLNSSVRCTVAVNNLLSDWMSIACCGVTVI